MNPEDAFQSTRGRAGERAFHLALLAATGVAVGALVLLLVSVVVEGLGGLSMDFLTQFPSRFPAKAGFKVAIVGSIWILGIVIVVAIPVGVGAAVYLEELASDNWFTRFIETNIANLAGVPSIVYGILGLAFFARALGLGVTVLTAGLTMSLLVLPVIVISSREALRAVPESIRQGGLALGATRWQVVSRQVLPAAAPGILTGCILATSRAIGETAPLLLIGAVTFARFLPTGLDSRYTAMPVQIFSWIGLPQKGFHELAAAGIMVLLAILLSMNAVAIYLRSRYERRW